MGSWVYQERLVPRERGDPWAVRDLQGNVDFRAQRDQEDHKAMMERLGDMVQKDQVV